MEITRRVIQGTLKGVEDYLSFTLETGEDFGDNWLPTLDLSIAVNKDNRVLYRYFEKPTSSNITVQKRTAIGEDAKVQILSNDMVRRLLNNSEAMGAGSKRRLVDDYAQKLRNSGYGTDQVRRIIYNGIRGYESKRRRCLENGWRLHRTSAMSQGARVKKKLLGKSSWFKKTKKVSKEGAKGRTDSKYRKKDGKYTKEPEHGKIMKTKSVLFVEQTPDGSLAKRMREVLRAMEPALGFRVKVVERTGQTLGSKFSQSSLWEGTMCGRENCITCKQEAEEIPPCTLSNLIYENICSECNPGATKKGELGSMKEGAPSLYVGESSRTIYERSVEHWGGVRKNDDKNHMIKHQILEHGNVEPRLTMKVVKFFKTPLARQVAEAVRIRRRGG